MGTSPLQQGFHTNSLGAAFAYPHRAGASSFWDVRLRFERINKVVRWPGAAQEQLDGLPGVEVTSGSPKGFDRSARHEEIEGQETAPVRIREFHLAANVEAGQGIPKLLHQQALVQG